MLSGVAPTEREQVWQEIATELSLEGTSGFEGSCELIVAWGIR